MSCLQYVSGQIRYAQMIALKRSMPLAHSLTGRIVFNGKQLDAGKAGMASASKVSVPTAPTALSQDLSCTLPSICPQPALCS